MDKEALVAPEIDAGKQLVSALEARGLPISVAMWLKRQMEGWKLYIASPDVEKHGPIAVYKFIDKAISHTRSPIDSCDVVAANTTNHFVNALAAVMGIRNTTARFTNCTFNGIPVEDAIVYKIARGVRASTKPPKFPTKKALSHAG